MGRLNLRRALALTAIGIAGHQMSCGQQTATFTSSSTFHREFLPPKVTSQTFKAARVESDVLNYDYEAQTLRQELALKADAPLQLSMHQPERTVIRDAFKQGDDGEPATKTYDVFEAGKLDLLVVIDDSPSMSSKQVKLATGLEPLLSEIANTDWHMMVTTTSGETDTVNGLRGCPRKNPDDPNDGPLITKSDYDADPARANARFAWKVRAGDEGSTVERGVFASMMGMNGFCGDKAQSWTRPRAHKAVLILTDEENCGSGPYPREGCPDLPGVDYHEFLEAQPGVQFFGLLDFQVQPVQPPCEFENWPRLPEQYRALIKASGGYEGSLCQSDYSNTLREISAHIDLDAKTDYDLEYLPVLASIHVELDGKPIPRSDFDVIGKSVHLKASVPRSAKKLTVGYQHDAAQRRLRFGLSTRASSETVKVQIDGMPVPPDEFTVDASTNEVAFNTMPADRSQITATYRTAGDLPRTFKVGADFVPDHVRVMVDGDRIDGFTANAATREVTLDESPSDGALVQIFYETEASRKLRYAAVDLGRHEASVSAVDGDTQEAIPVRIDGKDLVFQERDVRDGRHVTAVFTFKPDGKDFVLSLPNVPVDGSLAVNATGAECAQRAAASGATLKFPCPAEDLRKLSVDYDYVAELRNAFTLPGTFAPDSNWRVELNGKAYTDFTVDGSTVTIPKADITQDSIVSIEVSEPQHLP